MTNQRKIEILGQMLEVLDKRIHSFYLCIVIDSLYLDRTFVPSEHDVFKKWFKSKKPNFKNYPDIYKHPSFIKDSDGKSTWWRHEERLERKHFLETLINELKEEIA